MQPRGRAEGVNYIDSNICHGISLKKPSGNVGTRTCVAGISSQQKCYALDHHTSPKNACVGVGCGEDREEEEILRPLHPALA